MNNRYETPPIPEWGTLRQKQRNQVKSKFYYIFWGLATASVFAGQLYVGSGYRQMSRSFNRIVDSVVVELERSYDRQKFY
tara:strand:- start:283 stop:522 length:240 start_codon:yes stop_codon:yes gene_type:complete